MVIRRQVDCFFREDSDSCRGNAYIRNLYKIVV